MFDIFKTIAGLAHDSIKVMTLHVSKGLEFPVVALVGAGRMPAEGEDEREEARLFDVGTTRATQRLVIGASGNGKFSLAFISLYSVQGRMLTSNLQAF